jgi:hypothetical protein
MIITLVKANFSSKNIGTLNSFAVLTNLGLGCIYNGPTSVEKNSSFNATISISNNYSLNDNGLIITMGGNNVTNNAVVNNNSITISIAKVTGIINIIVLTSESGGGSTPVVPPVGDEETDLTAQFTWVDGAIQWSTGAVVNDTNWRYSDFVDIGNYTQLRFTQAATTTEKTSLGYALYDSDKRYVSGVTNGGAPSYVPIERIIDIPDTVKYIRTMWMNTTHASYDDSINNINNFYCYGVGYSEDGPIDPVRYIFTVTPIPDTATVTLSASGYDTVSGAGNQEITVAAGTNVSWTVSAEGYIPQSRTETVNQAVNKTVTLEEKSAPGAETDLTSQFTWTPGTVTAATGGVSTTDKNWVYSNAIDVSGYSQLKFAHIQTPNQQTSLGYTFYNSNMQAVANKTNGGTSYAPIERIVDIPSNAKFFRCMWINTSSANYDESIHDISKFYCYGIS